MLEYFYELLAGCASGFFIAIVIIELLKHKRRNSIIAIDFDTLVDIYPIIKRGKIYISNKKDVTLEQYFAAHVGEQQPNPKGILKAIHYQRVGYKIIYFSCRPEYLRLETAKILNDWDLKGELYMNTNKDSPLDFRINIMQHIKNNKKGKITGVVDDLNIANYYYEINNIDVL